MGGNSGTTQFYSTKLIEWQSDRVEVEFYKTEAEARAATQSHLDEFCADLDGWPEDPSCIEYGMAETLGRLELGPEYLCEDPESQSHGLMVHRGSLLEIGERRLRPKGTLIIKEDQYRQWRWHFNIGYEGCLTNQEGLLLPPSGSCKSRAEAEDAAKKWADLLGLEM